MLCFEFVVSLILSNFLSQGDNASIAQIVPSLRPAIFSQLSKDEYLLFLDQINISDPKKALYPSDDSEYIFRSAIDFNNDLIIDAYILQIKSNIRCGAQNCPIFIIGASSDNSYELSRFEGNESLYVSKEIFLGKNKNGLFVLAVGSMEGGLAVWEGRSCVFYEKGEK